MSLTARLTIPSFALLDYRPTNTHRGDAQDRKTNIPCFQKSITTDKNIHTVGMHRTEKLTNMQLYDTR